MRARRHHGERPLRKLFTKEQRAFYAEHAPPGIEIDELTVMGPIFVLKLRFTPSKLAKEMVAELWLYPDGSRILELSRKCLPEEAFEAAVETRAFLSEAGIDLGGLQETKTRDGARVLRRRRTWRRTASRSVRGEPAA